MIENWHLIQINVIVYTLVIPIFFHLPILSEMCSRPNTNSIAKLAGNVSGQVLARLQLGQGSNSPVHPDVIFR